jgi:PhnB protein
MAEILGQRLVPMLAYDDAPAALDFLCAAFGFEERYRMPMPDGSIGHAEIALGEHLVMLATSWKVAGFASPRDLPGLHGQLLCYVEDVDAHYARARRAGAVVIAEPRDQPYGHRSYRALDPEGHHWIFATPLPGGAG